MAWLVVHVAFGLGVLAVAGFGCGSWIANVLPTSFHTVERWTLALLGGRGVFSVALFLIGQASFTRGTIAAALIVAMLLASWPLWLAWRKMERIPRAIHGRIFVPASIVFIVLAVPAVSGLAEMTGDWNKDSVAHHLLDPTVWLRTGIIRPVLDNSCTSFPQIPETLFAALLAWAETGRPIFPVG